MHQRPLLLQLAPWSSPGVVHQVVVTRAEARGPLGAGLRVGWVAPAWQGQPQA